MNAAQIRAARGLLGWSQADLSSRSGVPLPAIEHLESIDASDPPEGNDQTMKAVRGALEASGVVFLDDGALVEGGPGVRMMATIDTDNLRETVQYPEFLSPEASTGSGG